MTQVAVTYKARRAKRGWKHTLVIYPFSPHDSNMNRDDAIARIKKVEPAIRALGAQSAYLFGSTARNEAKPSSDVDIFVDLDPSRPIGLFELMDMEEELAVALGTKVDLGTRTGLHPILRPEIEQSAIRIF
jgi:uncharacterized protein